MLAMGQQFHGCLLQSQLWLRMIEFLLLILLVQDSEGGPNERRLLEDLFNKSGYNKLERPVFNESDALLVTFGLTLQQIIDVNEKFQIISTNLWLNIAWRDYNLEWNPDLYGGLSTIRVPPAQLWRPDILMYNSADEDIDSTFHTNVVVSSTGDCLWVPPGLFLSTCTIDITWFPFDDQKCDMKFGSWTYDSSGINLTLSGEGGDISSFIKNGEWELITMPAVRSVKKYDCCPEEYIDITFTVHIRRRTLFYGFNLIIPCVLISSMALLAFTLPPDSGEKISLGVTIMLSLTVFLLLVAEAMPPTSDALPLIGMYFASTMLMCSMSVVFTVLVLNFHHRSPKMHKMPNWVRNVICVWLAWIVRMKRPVPRKSLPESVPASLNTTTGRPSHKDKQSSRGAPKNKDLYHEAVGARFALSDETINHPLMSVVYINNDCRVKLSSNPTDLYKQAWPSNSPLRQLYLQNGRCANNRSRSAESRRNSAHMTSSSSYHATKEQNGNVGNISEKRPSWRTAFSDEEIDGCGKQGCEGESGIFERSREVEIINVMNSILTEVSLLANKVRADDQNDIECSEWRFAAMVVDRICLYLFTTFTLISTFAILFSAPHIIA